MLSSMLTRGSGSSDVVTYGQNMAKWGLSQHPTHARKRSPAHATHALQRVLASPASQHVPPVLRTGLQGDIRDQLFLGSISVYMTLWSGVHSHGLDRFNVMTLFVFFFC